jgi:hypothetical protein
MELMQHQLDAIELMHNGCILHGGVGVGKTITALGYYAKNESPKPIYVITTARKRDSLDWQSEAVHFKIFGDPELSEHGPLVVDSWNNIKKYKDVKDAFFVFDEQRAVGRGTWAKMFVKLARKNNWVMLSATPGDTWMDYAPVFVANGFFENVTDFKRKHVLYEPYVSFPMVKDYLNVTKLELLRNHTLVEMPYTRHTKRVMNWVDVDHNKTKLDRVLHDRWHVYEDRPIKDAAELFRVMRKVVNSDSSRREWIRKLMKKHPRIIVFYNFDYELDLLRQFNSEIDVYEWNGHRKQTIPEGNSLLYLVQYVAGAEAWNCTSSDAVVFHSLTYSYKNFHQAQGRIDRLDTKYEDLYYYMFWSNSVVDRRIKASLERKEDFNERDFAKEMGIPWGVPFEEIGDFDVSAQI